MTEQPKLWWQPLLVGILYVVTFLYDILAYVPYVVLSKAYQKRIYTRRVKAKHLEENNPESPYRCVESFDKLVTSLHEDCCTLAQLFLKSVETYGDRKCLGYREIFKEEDEPQKSGRVFKKLVMADEYTWFSYRDIDRKAEDLGAGLQSLGQQPKSNIALIAETCYEWSTTAQACFRYNFPIVTIYSTLGEEAIEHGINESEATVVVTSVSMLPKLKKSLTKTPSVKYVVFFQGPTVTRADMQGFPSGLTVLSMQDVMQRGAAAHVKKVSPTSDDLAVIMYTSGSTGLPKGVMITHGNLMAGMAGQVPRIYKMGEKPDDIYIGYLPLAHVLELSAELACMATGVAIGYSTPLTLTDNSSKIKRGCRGDAVVLKPTMMAAVPVILDRLYKLVWENVNAGGPLMQTLFTFSYNYKTRRIGRGYDTFISNQLFYKRTRNILGGKLRLMLCGGAPLSPSTQKFMEVCFCCPMVQGYALTETCGAGTVAQSKDLKSVGRVGAPLCCNDLMLVDWPEAKYTCRDKPNPRGEILFSGANITRGYYKKPEKTAEDYREINGRRWFCTGDIGEIDPDGVLKIIDRKKDLVKLQAGEYVSLGLVESQLKPCPLVDNICIYGRSDKDFVVALVVPQAKQLREVADKLGVSSAADLSTLCAHGQVTTQVLTELRDFGLKAKLNKAWLPARVHLCPDQWTPDSGLVTDAFKLKRRQIEEEYSEALHRMYS